MNPPTTNPIKASGNNTTVTMNFDIPQAALIPKINNFPNTQIMHIANNNVNIFSPPIFSTIRLIRAVFLETAGIVLRKQFNEIPPHVEYFLSGSGKELYTIFYEMALWGSKYL